MGIDRTRINVTTCLLLLFLILFVSVALTSPFISNWLMDPQLMWESLQGGGLFFGIVVILIACIGYVFFLRRLTPFQHEYIKNAEKIFIIMIGVILWILIIPLLVAKWAWASVEESDPGSGGVVFKVVFTVTVLTNLFLFFMGLRVLFLHGD